MSGSMQVCATDGACSRDPCPCTVHGVLLLTDVARSRRCLGTCSRLCSCVPKTSSDCNEVEEALRYAMAAGTYSAR